MNILTIDDIEKISNSVNNYNSSPWNEDAQVILDSKLALAEETSVDEVVEALRRADIRGHHREEAECGNI